MRSEALAQAYPCCMGRAPRIEVPGGTYHVASRGNRGCRIYHDDADRIVFLKLLRRVAERYGWTCQAYCLMANHYHLLIQIGDGGLSSGMQALNGHFSCFTNARHGYEGHLFRNRFWSELIGEETHLLEACRYIVLNPIRARLCDKPEAWRWSSYRACAGLVFAPRFLATADLLALFGQTPAAARRAYRRFVCDGLVAHPVSDTVTDHADA
jgi:putative transposase